MDKNNIDQKALASLHKYFKDASEVKHEDTGAKELSKDDIINVVDSEIANQKKKLESLEALKENIDKKTEETYAKIFGHMKEIEGSKIKVTLSEMAQKLHEETARQLKHAKELKDEKLHK